jgi:hypothetical protein
MDKQAVIQARDIVWRAMSEPRVSDDDVELLTALAVAVVMVLEQLREH